MFRTPRPLLAATVLRTMLVAAFSHVAHAQLRNGQDDDLLDLVRRREQVEKQKVEAEIREGIREAQVLLQSSPTKAIQKLKQTLAQVEKDTLLPKERRDSFVRNLNERIRLAETVAARQAAKAKASAKRAAPEKSKPDLKTKNVKEDNRNSEANNLPSNSSAVGEPGNRTSSFAETRSPDVVEQARERTTRVAEEVIKARKAARDYERRVAGAFQDLDNSATAPAGDTEFPKDWKERTKGRSAGIQLTAKEKAILT